MLQTIFAPNLEMPFPMELQDPSKHLADTKENS